MVCRFWLLRQLWDREVIKLGWNLGMLVFALPLFLWVGVAPNIPILDQLNTLHENWSVYLIQALVNISCYLVSKEIEERRK